MTSNTAAIEERVVLVNPSGEAIGVADKATVHTFDTPLHLAFSCYVFNSAGEVLMTRRALDKVAWPGVWTNSFCGHPAPDESFEDAILRRGSYELGIDVHDVTVALPTFSYRAVDASGIVEHEFCPVFTARFDGVPEPNPNEVAEWAWMDFDAVAATAVSMPRVLSPWLVEQLELLSTAERFTD